MIWDGVNNGIGEGDSEDGEGDGGEAAHNRGERINSLLSSGSCSSSTSLRHFLVFLTGGVMTSSGEGGAGGLGLNGVGDGADDSPLAGVAKAGAAFIGVGKWTILAHAVLATRPRCQQQWCRRRRLPAVVVAVVDIGKLQDTVTTWTPVAWLNMTRAFSPLARQRSYNAEKSTVETAGGGLEQAVVWSRLDPSRLCTRHLKPRSLTWLWGRLGRWWGEGKHVTAGTQPARLAHLQPQWRGRRGGRGELTAILLVCCSPHPQWGGDTGSGAGVRV